MVEGVIHDPHQIAAWFSASSGLGIGLDLGKSGLVVVDGDHLGVLAETLPDDLLTGWTWHGNPDRRSWLFEVNGTPVPQAGHDWGEVKAGGGYVVLPPSPHQAEKCRACAEGDHCYVWENTDGDKPPTIADRLIPLLAKKPSRRKPPPTHLRALKDPGEVTEDEKRHADRLLRIWCEKVANTPASGGEYNGRNNTLNMAALVLGHLAPHYLHPDKITEALLKAAEENGLVRDKGETSARRTIASGLRKGMETPQRLSITVDAPETGDGTPTWTTGEGKWASGALGQRLAHERLRGKYLYVSGLGWHQWDGMRWKKLESDAPVLRKVAEEWVVELLASIPANEGATLSPDDLGKLIRQVARYREVGRLAQLIEGAKLGDGMTVHASALDAHPHLLNAQNGIVDLRTGELVPHDPNLLMSNVAGVPYEPGFTTRTGTRHWSLCRHAVGTTSKSGSDRPPAVDRRPTTTC